MLEQISFNITEKQEGIYRLNNIEIKEKVKFDENEFYLLKQACLDKYSNYEAWTAIGTNRQLAYSTHGLYRYYGKFPAPIAKHLINTYTEKGDTVWDVMSGSGTTGVEAILEGRNAVLFDVNPLSRLIARSKTTYIEKSVLLEYVNYIENNYKPLTVEEYDFYPIGLRNTEHWFLSETINSLRGIKKLIEDIDNIKVKEFLYLVFLSTVRPVSKATTQQGRLFLDVESAKADALDTFLKRAKKAIEEVSKLPNDNTVEVIEHNLKNEFKEEYNGKLKLVIAHPPYFNSYKYSSINSLELSWLGINHAEVRNEEVKEFFKIGKPEKVEVYVEDMVKCINNALKLLDKNGVFALMIGDTTIRNEYIPVTQMILEKLELKDVKIEKVILREPQYTEASWAASQRRKSGKLGIELCDFIVIFRREND